MRTQLPWQKNDGAFQRSIVYRRPYLSVAVLVVLMVVLHGAYSILNGTNSWYSSGAFVKYHMQVTPEFYFQSAFGSLFSC